MRLCAALLTDTLLDSASQPPLQTDPFRAPARRWQRAGSAPHYRARMDSPHPRTLRIPNADDNAYILIPNAPKTPYRLILGNGDYAPVGNIGLYLSKDATYTLVQDADIDCPTNGYATHTIDPSVLFGDIPADPALAMLQLNARAAPAHEIGDLKLLASVDLDPILASLTPTETNYDLALFTPLAERALMGRTLRTRAYTLDLLLERDNPAYPFLTRLRDYDQLYLEQDDRYMPVALADFAQTPAGGMLYAIQLKLAATDAYAIGFTRYIRRESYTGGVISYTLPGDAPAPVEIRVQLNNNPPANQPITVYLAPAGESLTFKPDAAGVWSIHDSGRIYHCPTDDPAPLIDRTDTLQSGALPLIAPPGDGHLALEHDPAYNTLITDLTLAAYPRYQPDQLL